MHELFFFLAQAAPAGARTTGIFDMVVPFACIGIIFYFLVMRPQKKKQQDHAKLVGALKTGDEVVTAGGIHGRVSNVKDTTLVLKIAENVKVEIEKASVERRKLESEVAAS